MNVTRYDYSDFKATKTDEGFLVDSPIVARIGIQEYRRADGSIRRELRLPEEVFNADALASMRGKPITIGHPGSGKVTSKDAHRVTVGTILDAGVQDGDNVRTNITIHSPDAIGSKRELSLGYTAKLDETPGEWNGQRYDAIQRDIRVNHLSVVDRGRAGVARLNLDSDEIIDSKDDAINSLKDAIALHEKHMTGKAPTTGPEGKKSQQKMMDMMKSALSALGGAMTMDYNEKFFNQQEQQTMTVKVKLDGLEYDAAPEVSRELDKLRADVADAKTKLDAATAAKDVLQAKVDAQADALTAAKEQGRADALARLTLESTATKFKVDAADKSDREVKELVIKAVRKDADLKDKSDVYVDAAFDMALEVAPVSNMASQRQAVNNRTDAAAPVTGKTAYATAMANLGKKEGK